MAITISNDFPGGNIVFRGYRGDDRVLLRRDTWGSKTSWVYFCFDAACDEKKIVTFDFEQVPHISSGGVAYSTDGGVTWDHIPMGENCTKTMFRYPMEPGKTVRFCLGAQYMPADLERFLAKTPSIRKELLCKSNKGRNVELLRLTDDGAGRIPLLLTSRHHACEMHGTHVMEGLLAAAAEDPDFLKMYDVWAVPFVDKDGVMEGMQGKDTIPHDHNRDYIEKSIYAEVKALKALNDKVHFPILLDFHCPGLWRELIYFFGSPNPRCSANLEQLIELIGKYGPQWLNLNLKDNYVPFGTGWNTVKPDGMPSTQYFATFPWARIAASNEISYDLANGHLLTVEKLHEYGKGVKEALKHLVLK